MKLTLLTMKIVRSSFAAARLFLIACMIRLRTSCWVFPHHEGAHRLREKANCSSLTREPYRNVQRQREGVVNAEIGTKGGRPIDRTIALAKVADLNYAK
jgi:hypothetical protein